MKILKRILSILLIFIVLLIIASFFAPKSLQLKEDIEINTSTAPIYNEIINFKDWSEWSPWHQIDSNMTNIYSDTMGEIGSFNQWKSNNSQVGNGIQSIVDMTKNTYVKIEMQFEGWDSKNYSIFQLDSIGANKTKVSWSFEGGEMPFYYRLMSTLFMKSAIEKSYKKGLTSLKNVVESKPKAIPMPKNTKLVDVEAEMTLAVKDSADVKNIGNKLANIYKDIMVFATIHNMTQSGAPMAYYEKYSPEKIVFEAAIPMEGDLKGDNHIQLKEKEAGKALKTVHMGDYQDTEKSHQLINEYIQSNGLEMNGTPYEVYVTDPAAEADTTKWETDIYYPVK